VTLRTLMATLFRRLSSLCYFHCGVELDLPFKELLRLAEQVTTVHSSFTWMEQRRYSTRQHRLVHVDGLVGEATFRGAMGPFLPFLLAGELVHVGKGCVFGAGKYSAAVERRTTGD